jgi:tyrosine-protein kinase Etk/Wzc
MEEIYQEYHDEQEINLTDYLNVILRYKWLVLAIFITVLIVAAVYTAKAPRIYKATSKLLIEENMSEDMIFGSWGKQQSSINNKIQILKSRPVLAAVHEILKRDKDYESFPIANLEKGSPTNYLNSRLEVETERETDVLIISYKSTNPKEAKAAANATAYALQEQDTNYARTAFRTAREFLEAQLEEADRRLRIAEEDLRLYKIEHGISLLSEETQALIEKSSDMEANLASATAEYSVAKEHLQYLKKELEKQDVIVSDVNTILSTPLLEQLKSEIVENQRSYVNYLTKSGYSKNHPQLIELNNAIESAKTKLSAEIDRVTKIKSGSSDPLKYRAQLINDIAKAEIEENILSAKVKSLEEAVEDYNTSMAHLPDTEVELARLTRNFTINEKIYSMLIEKFEDAKIVEKSKIGNVRIIEEALTPESPISPNKKMNMLIALVLGAGMGFGIALLLHSLDSKIRTFDDVRKFVGLKVLGTIPYIHKSDTELDEIEKQITLAKDSEKDQLIQIKNQMESRLVTNYSPKSSASESFRILRTNILAKLDISKSNTLLITSSGPKEGKSTSQANLATALAQMDSKVILIDLDLRRPMIHKMFGLEKDHGMSDFLMDKTVKLESLIIPSKIKNLDLITSGHVPPNPSELISSKRMDEALELLKEKYDYVLIDAPPIIAVTDSMILAKKVDLVNITVRVGQADKKVVKRTKELLEIVGVTDAGAIINGINPQKYYSSYEYNYYYYYYYGTEETKNKKLR